MTAGPEPLLRDARKLRTARLRRKRIRTLELRFLLGTPAKSVTFRGDGCATLTRFG